MTQVKLEITFEVESGRVNVDGPLENRLVCYGMLEMAREIIARQTPAEGGNGASKIVVPQFLPPKLVP